MATYISETKSHQGRLTKNMLLVSRCIEEFCALSINFTLRFSTEFYRDFKTKIQLTTTADLFPVYGQWPSVCPFKTDNESRRGKQHAMQ